MKRLAECDVHRGWRRVEPAGGVPIAIRVGKSMPVTIAEALVRWRVLTGPVLDETTAHAPDQEAAGGRTAGPAASGTRGAVATRAAL